MEIGRLAEIWWLARHTHAGRKKRWAAAAETAEIGAQIGAEIDVRIDCQKT